MKIVSLTLNPSLDKSTRTDHLLPDEKLRCEAPVYEPGGGGINVSRAIKHMGGDSLAIYLAGGASGEKMQELLKEEGIQQQIIRGKNATRENFIITESTTNRQYRFGMPGAEVTTEELQQCLQALKELPDEVEYLVASGSLPPGAPDDFYGQVARIAREQNIQCVIDTSGPALQKAAEMGVCMMKPNLGELSKLADKEHISAMEQEEVAKRIIEQGKAQLLIVSLGPRGAMLATKDKIEYVVPPTVKQQSTVGAGDSMVGGIILSLSRGDDLSDVIKWGVAAGTAATMTPGSELCRKEDVEEIFAWLKHKEKTGA
ncbi:1-phosphofructokinase family hexose kinase [Nafulsella turpanensis]|uniref:1-phosphofructokinase family hexose kinase n=1 Tax=Nafulsella turpanensis TaxID=1265690 RepID=UPI0003458DBC|nr:1-phosphofructokinase family hexose kinase [Nafulsella turpanensis]